MRGTVVYIYAIVVSLYHYRKFAAVVLRLKNAEKDVISLNVRSATAGIEPATNLVSPYFFGDGKWLRECACCFPKRKRKSIPPNNLALKHFSVVNRYK